MHQAAWLVLAATAGFLPGPSLLLQKRLILSHKLKKLVFTTVTHSEGYIHKSPFPLPGATFQAHVSKKTQRQFPNTTGSAYLTVLASLCFLIQCFSFATTEVRDYRAGSRGG